MAAVRQSLWRTPGRAKGDPRTDDTKPSNATDIARWVDTDVMLCDPLTKKMDATKLWEALDSNHWGESLQNRAKQEQRRKTVHYSEEEEQDVKRERRSSELNIPPVDRSCGPGKVEDHSGDPAIDSS